MSTSSTRRCQEGFVRRSSSFWLLLVTTCTVFPAIIWQIRQPLHQSFMPPDLAAEANATSKGRISYADAIDVAALAPSINNSLPPVSFGGCCGIGHRLARNIPVMVYGTMRSRLVHASWRDVLWNELFNDTDRVVSGPPTADFHGNGYPESWEGGLVLNVTSRERARGTAADNYELDMHKMFHMPIAQAIVKSMRDSLSPLVLSFLSPLRSQYSKPGLHLCAHVREGNNETGDWKGKTWRHIELLPVLHGTLSAMLNFAQKREANDVTVFVASDNAAVRPWFQDNIPKSWSIVRPVKFLPSPKSGVWFGEAGSNTNAVLNQTQKNAAMAEAVADMFALGECDALYIPNYSSFTLVSILLMRLERLPVFFRENSGTNFTEVHESEWRSRPQTHLLS